MTGARAPWHRIAILLIVVLAFGLRLYAIDRQDIWGDEAFSIWLSSQPLPEVVAGGADTHPPLYPFSLYLWLRLAGSSPLATRCLSAAFGTLAVAVTYGLGRRALSRTTGLLAALLAAASPVLVYYGQETRMYELVALLAAASLYWTVRVVATGHQSGRVAAGPLVAYLVTALSAAYTHYYAFFVILAENLVVIATLWRHRRWPALCRWLAVQSLLALAYLPWVAVQTGFLGGKASARFGEWNLATGWHIAGDTLAAFAAGLAVGPAARWTIAALFGVAATIGSISIVWKRPVLRRPRSLPSPSPDLSAGTQTAGRPASWLILGSFILPLFLAWAIHPVMPFFYARYLLLIAPAFYLLAAAGGMALAAMWKPAGAVLALLLLSGSAYGLHATYTDESYVKGRYGQMMAFVRAQAEPGDALVLANQLQRPLFEYYRPPGLDAYFFPRFEYLLEDPRTARDLEAIAARHPRLWLVRFGNPAEYDPGGSLVRWLATHGSKAYFGGWVDADLSLYVMAPAAVEGTEIQHPLQADLGGGVRLLGYALGAETVSPGETLLLTLYWQARQPMAERYTVFTHLLDPDQRIVAQMDSEPQGGGLPTDRWPPEEIVVDNYALQVAPGATPGPHLLEVGMYLLSTGDRLAVLDPQTGQSLGDRVLLGTIEVDAP